ncbi:UPF0676 protein C1494.01-like [Penaeus chinensis]|uniref:UPF0676 protein C1494.01-like n=1 Tax=Penaeus chinensis TaxID=139456 RepID=UPI001FB66B88|nr:UPF0676 protein C1494.01-like [Penaeus chinensis]
MTSQSGPANVGSPFEGNLWRPEEVTGKRSPLACGPPGMADSALSSSPKTSRSSGEPSIAEWDRVGREVCQAFSGIGFVYLKNHGLPNEMVKEVNDSSGKFFQLENTKKRKYERGVVDIQGYTAVGRERLSEDRTAQEFRESYDVKRPDGMFPDEEVPDMRPSVETFMNACKDLTRKILVAMAIGLGASWLCLTKEDTQTILQSDPLKKKKKKTNPFPSTGLEPAFFVSNHQQMCTESNTTCLRILYYPSLPESVPGGSIRCAAHTDYGTVTLLFQDDVGGLQVCEALLGRWIDAVPVPGAVLVNVGDILQFWTSGKLRATEHRVLIPPEETRRRSPRRSVVFFVHPDDPVLITPLDGSSAYRPITAKDHSDLRFRQTYEY